MIVQAHTQPSINLIPLSNYEMLELFGMIDTLEGGQCKLSDNFVVLRDDADNEFTGKNKLFPLSELFDRASFTPQQLRKVLKQRERTFKHLRTFLSFFRRQGDGRLSQKHDYWLKFKAWRYDIDHVYPEDYIQDLIRKLPLLPNILKRSNKGWHLIYVFDRFIERSDVEAYKSYNEKTYLPYMVYEILTKLLPIYLKELEPQIDVQASNNVSKIATRFISEKLPAYVINPEYSLEVFFNAYSFLTKKVFEYESDYDLDSTNNKKANNKKAVFTIQDIAKGEFYTAISKCGVLKALDEDWENHSYEEWFLMTTLYAIKIIYAENEEERDKLEQEFYEKSSRYRDYKPHEAEYLLKKLIEYQSKSLKIYGCKKINEVINQKYLQACKSCPYKKVDREGNIYGHYLFSYLYKENLEDDDVTIPGWVLRENGWNIYDAETGIYTQILPYFKIRTYYILGEAEEEFVEIVDKRGISYIKKVERRKDSYKPSVDLVKSFGAINPDFINQAKRFLAIYIEKVKEKRGIKVDFVGYKNIINDSWDIIVGGYGKYSRKEIDFIFYGKEMESLDWYIPEVKGSEEVFKLTYQKLLRLNDPPLHLTIAHYLSWIGREFIKDRAVLANINPILILVGDTGTGKSIRAKLATALYGRPFLYSFTAISQAGFSNRFPLIKTPFAIDEVIMRTANDERKFGELVYNITNIHGKMTFNNTYNPIDVPIVLTGETENLLINKAFDTFRGLNRRSIVIEMTENWRENSDLLDNALDNLQLHHGHVLGYVKSLKEEDKTEIAELIKRIQAKLQFGDSSFKDLSKHLALSLAMFYHFFKQYIGMSKDEIMDKVNAVIEFVAEQINKKQVVRIGESVDYVEEVINFIAKVDEALNDRKSLKGLSYEKLCNVIGYTPANRVGMLLKKFFWKRYTNSSNKSTHLRFVPGVLIINPFIGLTDDDKAAVIQTDRDRLIDLTEEELKIWADVLKARYNDETVKRIVDTLRNERLSRIIDLKVSTTSEPEPEKPELDIPF